MTSTTIILWAGFCHSIADSIANGKGSNRQVSRESKTRIAKDLANEIYSTCKTFRECYSICETFRESIPYIINSFWKSMIRGIFRECNSISFETFRESISLNISLSWNLGQHGFAEIKLMSLVAVNNQNNNDWLNDWRWNSWNRVHQPEFQILWLQSCHWFMWKVYNIWSFD